ncbi:MAG: histidine--tRNA ligase [Cyanobacteria bacterium]|nr:histidine--tRNA ligase [Cyanobacteriota bacterium]
MDNIQRPKGTQDILPGSAGAPAHGSLSHISLWQWIEATARQQLGFAGYQEIRTPVFESTELFSRGVGESTDIVNKEMYTFEKGDRSLTLRPEGTAGVVRAYIENGLSRWPKPVKLYYAGPMFRYERPQAGRQRQFHQLGVEVLGLDNPQVDVEVIATAMRLFTALNIPHLTLQINNMGDEQSRAAFRQKLQAFFKPYLSQLCESCQVRFEVNPFRMLDCKESGCNHIYQQPDCQSLLQEEWANEESQQAFRQVCESLTALGIPFERNHRLVRGLDYYTQTVFEITSNHLGAQNAVCGGGRYNQLVETLGGPPTPAVGWAVGLERLATLVQKPAVSQIKAYVVHDDLPSAIALQQRLLGETSHDETSHEESSHEISCEVDLSGKGFGKQLEQAAKRGATFALILGAQERENKQVQIKNLTTGEVSSCDFAAIKPMLLSAKPQSAP